VLNYAEGKGAALFSSPMASVALTSQLITDAYVANRPLCSVSITVPSPKPSYQRFDSRESDLLVRMLTQQYSWPTAEVIVSHRDGHVYVSRSTAAPPGE